ncbi:MAG: excinuclease ABC subunit UvrC [bacterium]|nr:excinuclease ABC subunit UvrC [bacterium]
MKKNIEKILTTLPITSGVYFFKDNKNNIIYIGKAKNLKKRVLSYFRKEHPDFKTTVMIPHIRNIDFMQTNNEEEALLWENTLIKRFKPKYNIMLKDDKTYPYLKITNEKYPAIYATRQISDDGADYFGPYVDSGNLQQIIRLIKKIFPIRKCRKKLIKISRPSLNYFMGKCYAPCMGDLDESTYAKIIQDIKRFIKSDYKFLKKQWKLEINTCIKKQEFEKANILKERILTIEKLENFDIRVWEIKETDLHKLSKVYRAREEDLANLENILNIHRKINIIAGFDISTLGGKYSVGSRVVFQDSKPKKSMYRKYRIKTVSNEKTNDFAMMQELIRRTLQADDLHKIDLFVIDGGKGQLNIAISEMDLAHKKIPILSIAKKQEILFLPKQSNGIRLEEDSEALKLIRYVRDEAHRFAITYHKNIRKKNFLEK